MLSWCNRFNICCFLDNHNYNTPHHTFECIAGVGVLKFFTPNDFFFESLNAFVEHAKDYIFGHFNYELKDRIEKQLSSSHHDISGFPEFFLFIPEVTLILDKNSLHIGVVGQNPHLIYKDIMDIEITDTPLPQISLNPRVSKNEYLDNVQKLLAHIYNGDCYVINYCQEFFAKEIINPLSLYKQLCKISPNPFASYYRLNDKYVLCASPERFLKKEGRMIVSQPIKGTSPRDHRNHLIDSNNKKHLAESEKERSENVMVVDLVRNDMGKISETGTVQVEELFGLYSFPSVHQMISTVCGELMNNVGFGDIIKAMFPMGSMTGAPKYRVMELTDLYEKSRRGVYSGTIGYISPTRDFDFNVVIRSLVYNSSTHYLSYHTGSAITAYCTPEDEYNECLLKGQVIADILGGNILNSEKFHG